MVLDWWQPPEGPGARFTFSVPSSQPASDLTPHAAWSRELGSRTRDASLQPDQRYHEWQLVVQVAGPGIGLRRTCIVEVRPPMQQRLRDTARRREFEPGTLGHPTHGDSAGPQ